MGPEKLTYCRPDGEWGIEGVDLSTLSPKVYRALHKLMQMEHRLLVEPVPQADHEVLIRNLMYLKKNVGGLSCLGCGYEQRDCGSHGCAIIRDAISAVTACTQGSAP